MREIRKNNSGFILLSTLLVMSLLLLLAVYVINFTITEFKISTSQATATQAYYLAESGVAETIWRLKNDATWKTNYETNPNWSVTYTRNSVLYPNGSYTITITNDALAHGQIVVTGYMDLGGGKKAKRVVKTIAYKTLGGTSPVGDNAEFSDGNLDLSGTVLNIYGGSIHANGNAIINFWSILNVANKVSATGNVIVNQNSALNGTKVENAPAVTMPSISFDNPGDINSYRSRASQIYTQSEFENLMWDNPNLTLSGIHYVDGNITIKANQNIIINGTLVASGNIKVGANTLFCCWGLRCGRSNITINKKAIGKPSGLLAKGRIDFELCLDNFNANGVVYANDKVNILSMPGSFNVIGGVIGRKFSTVSIWQGANITLNTENQINVLGGAAFSPVVTIDHWEEEY